MKTKSLITAAVVATLGLGAVGIGIASAHGQFGPGYGMGYSQNMGPGMMQGKGFGPGQGYCNQAAQPLAQPLTVDDVRARVADHLKWRGNDRLKVGNVTEKADNIIAAEIVTVDDSLVRTIEIDKTTGRNVTAGMPGGGFGPGSHPGGFRHWR